MRFSLFSSIVDRLSIFFSSTRVQSHNIRRVNIFLFSKVVINSPDDLGKLLNEQQPKLSKNLNLQVSDRVAVSDSISISKNGVEYIDIPGFGMVERPSDTEIELVKKARGDKPYNAIWDVKLGKDEQGNITSLQWSEN